MTPIRDATPVIAVVIPCYRVKAHALSVVRAIGPEVSLIIIVDDACPEESGRWTATHAGDSRVHLVHLLKNLGVGGAVLAGYRKAIELGASVIVKVDGDGQMNPALIPQFVAPIVSGEADYTKGNRFFDLESLKGMPLMRIIGNAGLSFITKLSTGYWKVMDPTNGYTAIDARIAAVLPHQKIASRYFFESDMLFRLNTLQAVVRDIPMDAHYADEQSNLRIKRVLWEFPARHAVRFAKRIFYTYFLRDFNAASVELVLGLALGISGVIFGAFEWARYSALGVSAPTGTVLLATIQVILGTQFVLSWITYDVNGSPDVQVSSRLRGNKTRSALCSWSPANQDDDMGNARSRTGS